MTRRGAAVRHVFGEGGEEPREGLGSVNGLFWGARVHRFLAIPVLVQKG